MINVKNLVAASAFMILASCSPNETERTAGTKAVATTTPHASFIHKDTANRMLESYLTSVGYPEMEDSLRSWQVASEALRDLLMDETITELKISLAHSLDFINGGKFGQPAGFSPAALTLIISGVNASGNTVFYPTNKVVNRMYPCPPNCGTGSAANATF